MPIRLAAIASLVLLAATAARAGTPAGTNSRATAVAPVTVQAPALTPSEAVKRSDAFVAAYAAPTAALDQYARWHSPICVKVVGVLPEEAAAISSRIEQVARALGLKVGAPGCRSNIQILFSGHPQALVDAVAKRNDALLGYHYPAETQALKTVTRPVQAWYATASRSGGVGDVELAFMAVDNPYAVQRQDRGDHGSPKPTNMGMLSLDKAGEQTPAGCGDSRFSTCRSSLFANVMVVVDSRRLQGKTLGPLSDYVAMLALSQPKSLDGCLDLASVIDLFAPRPCPGRPSASGLTTADAGYLTALYGADPEERRSEAQTDMAERMAKILVDPSPVVLTALHGASTGGH